MDEIRFPWYLPTATTIALVSSLLSSQPGLTPNVSPGIAADYSHKYEWDQNFSNPYYRYVESTAEVHRKAEILFGFASQLVAETEDLDPKFAEVVTQHFSELI